MYINNPIYYEENNSGVLINIIFQIVMSPHEGEGDLAHDRPKIHSEAQDPKLIRPNYLQLLKRMQSKFSVQII